MLGDYLFGVGNSQLPKSLFGIRSHPPYNLVRDYFCGIFEALMSSTMRPRETCMLKQNVNVCHYWLWQLLPASQCTPQGPTYVAGFLTEFVLSTLPPKTISGFKSPHAKQNRACYFLSKIKKKKKMWANCNKHIFFSFWIKILTNHLALYEQK